MHRSMRIALLLSFVVLLAVVVTPRKAVLHAQNGCDATTLNAVYGAHLTGSVYDNQGYIYVLAAVGRF